MWISFAFEGIVEVEMVCEQRKEAILWEKRTKMEQFRFVRYLKNFIRLSAE